MVAESHWYGIHFEYYEYQKTDQNLALANMTVSDGVSQRGGGVAPSKSATGVSNVNINTTLSFTVSGSVSWSSTSIALISPNYLDHSAVISYVIFVSSAK